MLGGSFRIQYITCLLLCSSFDRADLVFSLGFVQFQGFFACWLLWLIFNFRAVSEHLLISCFPEWTVQRDMSDFFLFASAITPIMFLPKSFRGIRAPEFSGIREPSAKSRKQFKHNCNQEVKKNQQSASLHHEEADRKHRRCLAASRRTSKRRRCVKGWTEFLSQRLRA